MASLRILHMILAFSLELAMLAAFFYWGYHGDKKTSARFLWGFNLPVIAIILWWFLAAPKSSYRLEQPYLLLFKMVLFGLAAYGLYRSEQPGLAAWMAGLAVVSVLAEYFLKF